MLDLNGRELKKELDRVATDDPNELEFHIGTDKSATIEFNRTWRNGWALTTYAKAWWNGERIVGGAGIGGKKTF